jgi:hypothetical protein
MDTPPPPPPAADRGRSVPYTLPRRWIGDMLHAARRVPVVAAERALRVRAMYELRRQVPKPPSWSSLMIKALGLVSMRVPEMRRAYLGFPWARLYEAPYSVASVIFTREFRGELATFFAPMLHPERLELGKIDQKVQAWKADPVAAHGVLRRLVRNAKPPRPVRRFLWWFGLNWFGMMRARYFGTFAVNSIAATTSGRMLQFQTPLTQVVYYGAVTKAGELPLQLAFDHRVYDGVTGGRIASEIEAALNNELIAEVRALGEAA